MSFVLFCLCICVVLWEPSVDVLNIKKKPRAKRFYLIYMKIMLQLMMHEALKSLRSEGVFM